MLPECRAIKAAVDEYRESNDWFGEFIAERCEVKDEGITQSGVLYQTYRDWAQARGEYVRSTTDFSTALQNAGFEWKRLKNGRFWKGLKLTVRDFESEELPF